MTDYRRKGEKPRRRLYAFSDHDCIAAVCWARTVETREDLRDFRKSEGWSKA